MAGTAKPSSGTEDKATTAGTTGSTTAQKEAGSTPVDPTRFQLGEEIGAPITTNPPRGVNEPPADALADEPAAAALQEHVVNVIQDEERRGFRGSKRENVVPNENYTLRGVGRGLPTPETTVHTPGGSSSK